MIKEKTPTHFVEKVCWIDNRFCRENLGPKMGNKWFLQNGVSFNLGPTTDTKWHKCFSTKWVYGHVVARDGLYKMGAENFHDQLLPNQPQTKSSTKWHWVLRRVFVYKMGSTKWGLPTPPTPKRGGYPFYFAHGPTHFVEEIERGMVMWKQNVNYIINNSYWILLG